MKLALLAVLALPLAPSAQGTERFVDVDSGSDANDGLTPETAWKTLTHAFGVAHAGTSPGYDVLHVAPGHYVEGVETMPLFPPPLVHVIGDPAERPVVESLTRGVFEFNGNEIGTPLGTVLEALEVRVAPAATGVRLTTFLQSLYPTLRDVVISGGTYGITVHEGPFSSANLYVEDTLIEGCETGIELGPRARVFLTDSEIRSCSTGLRTSGTGSLDRCLVHQNGTGVQALRFVSATGINTIQNSLVVDNTEFGIDNSAQGYVALENVTVAGNAVGLHARVVIDSSIVWRNGIDATDPDSEASFSIVGDPVDCTEGCLSVDPMFVDGPGGDYRPTFGSPAVDAAAPDLTTLDPLGTQRPVDGDLDTARRADMGAFELAPLTLAQGAAPGESLEFELWGEVGSASLLFAALGPPAPPLPTAFGLLELDPGSAVYLGVVSPAPGPPGGVSVLVPNEAGLSGVTLSFQAGTSSSAPSGGAWTNVVATTVE